MADRQTAWGRSARIVIVAAAAALTITTATPVTTAFAARGPRILASIISDISVAVAPAPGKAIQISILAETVTDVTITLDLSRLAGVVRVNFFDDACAVTAAAAVCPLPSTDTSYELAFPVRVTAESAAAKGANGFLGFQISASGLRPVTGGTRITLDDGFDVVATFPSKTISSPVRPGERQVAPIAFVNAGNQVVHGVQVSTFLDSGLIPVRFDNCTYRPQLHGTRAVCEFDDVLQPGAGVEAAIELTIAPDAGGSRQVNYVLRGEGKFFPTEPDGLDKPHTGKKLALKKSTAVLSADEIDGHDNFGKVTFSQIVNVLDLGPRADSVSGKVGDVVTVRLIVHNFGYTLDREREEFGETFHFAFVVPPGTVTTAVPDICVGVFDGGTPQERRIPRGLGAPHYVCRGPEHFLGSGRDFPVPFGLKIKNVGGSTTGSVTMQHPLLRPDERWRDDNPANDTADVVVLQSDAQGGLPTTGAPTALIAAAGSGLVIAGGLLFLLTRRRTASARSHQH